MKRLIIITCLLCASASFACTDTRYKPGYLSAKKVECGRLWNDIVDPKITIKGKSYPLGILAVDGSGICPTDDFCFMPLINFKKRLNAICQAYGFGNSSNSRDSGYLKNFSTIGVLKLENNVLSPALVKIANKYVVLKTISCLPRP